MTPTLQVDDCCFFSLMVVHTRSVNSSPSSMLLLYSHLVFLPVLILGFSPHGRHRFLSAQTKHWLNNAGGDSSTVISDSLKRLVIEREGPERDDDIMAAIHKLEAGFVPDNHVDDEQDLARFDNLIGLYEVAFTKTVQPNENPVGGKWTRNTGVTQKIFRTRRRSFQHILRTNSTGLGKLVIEQSKGYARTVVAEAINVISLEAFRGLLRITVILRGDATPLTPGERNDPVAIFQPLSNRTVRAWFDAPRIVLVWNERRINLQLGPKSSVLLDTLFVNDILRLGMGGRSGTRFVFVRCQENDKEANEFRRLLMREPIQRSKILLLAGAVSLFSLSRFIFNLSSGVASKTLQASIALISTLVALFVGVSTGGIERDQNRYQFFTDNSVE